MFYYVIKLIPINLYTLLDNVNGTLSHLPEDIRSTEQLCPHTGLPCALLHSGVWELLGGSHPQLSSLSPHVWLSLFASYRFF